MKEKNKIIKKSFIFTAWGIWEISCLHHMKKEMNDEISKILQYYLDKIYFKTNGGKNLDFIEVKDILSMLMKKLKYHSLFINLTPWQAVVLPFSV